MTPDQIRAAATARKAASERKAASSNRPDPLELMRKAPAGQGIQTAPSQKVDVLDPVQGDPTMVTPILDNVVGLDNGVMSPGEKAGTALHSAGESLTLGLIGDEAAAGFDSMIGVGSYEDRLTHYRDNQEQLGDEHPMVAFASEVAPALIPGMGGAALIKGLTSGLGRAGAGAVLGALSGGVYGSMEGEGGIEGRAKQGAVTAGLGSLFGAAAPKVIDAVSKAPRGIARAFQRSVDNPTIQSLKTAKNAAYRAVDNSGEMFSPEDMARLHQKVTAAFDEGHFVEETDTALKATLRILEKRSGKNTTLSQLDGIRQNLWKRYAGAKDQPQILDAISAIDDLIEERAGASELMGLARAANSRFSKFQLLDKAFTNAKDQAAATGSGGNVLNLYRQAVKNILKSEKQAKFFTPEEIGLMRGFVRGSFSENLLRKVGKLSPNGNGLMMTLHAVGGVASQGATIPLAIAGAGAKSLADRGAFKGAEVLKNTVAGKVAPKVVNQLTGGQGAAISAAVPALTNEGIAPLLGR